MAYRDDTDDMGRDEDEDKGVDGRMLCIIDAWPGRLNVRLIIIRLVFADITINIIKITVNINNTIVVAIIAAPSWSSASSRMSSLAMTTTMAKCGPHCHRRQHNIILIVVTMIVLVDSAMYRRRPIGITIYKTWNWSRSLKR